MEGFIKLIKLPLDIQNKIISEFGGIESLYQNVFDLNAESYRLTGTKNPRLDEIRKELFDIENKLEEFGIMDGSDFTSEISSDFGDIIVSKRINNLNKYLAQFGTDFDTMQKWLKDKYGI